MARLRGTVAAAACHCPVTAEHGCVQLHGTFAAVHHTALLAGADVNLPCVKLSFTLASVAWQTSCVAPARCSSDCKARHVTAWHVCSSSHTELELAAATHCLMKQIHVRAESPERPEPSTTGCTIFCLAAYSVRASVAIHARPVLVANMDKLVVRLPHETYCITRSTAKEVPVDTRISSSVNTSGMQLASSVGAAQRWQQPLCVAHPQVTALMRSSAALPEAAHPACLEGTGQSRSQTAINWHGNTRRREHRATVR